MMKTEILEEALKLRPEERSIIVEGLLKSLDAPDPNIDAVWIEEAERRLAAHRAGRLGAVPFEEVFKDES